MYAYDAWSEMLLPKSKCGKRIGDSDDVQILIEMCWRMCVTRPREFWPRGLNAVIQRTVLFGNSFCAIVHSQKCRFALTYSRWLAVCEAWKGGGIPIWFESTLLPQTEIFTVWMNLKEKKSCVYTLLVYIRTCALSAVNRVHMERRALRFISLLGNAWV